MDYKIELQKNNEDLNNIIDKAKALPDAGTSGSGEPGGGSGDISLRTQANGVYNDGAFASVNFYSNFSATASGALTE